MSPRLEHIIEEWIQTTGLPGLSVEIAEDHYDYRAWLCFEDYPVKWSSIIFSDYVEFLHHGSIIAFKACDPNFFAQLYDIIKHRSNALDCSFCKSEVTEIFQNYD